MTKHFPGNSGRVLVTGASGFVGSHLLPYLYEAGYEIWASRHRLCHKHTFPVHWISADLLKPQDCFNLVKKSQPQYLFHLAGLATPKESWRNSTLAVQSNVGASINLLEGVCRYVPGARVVLVSSAHVYGRTFASKSRIRENDLADPVTPYGGSKLLMEIAARNFISRHGLNIVIARGFNQVGRGQNPQFVFSDFCRQVALIEKRRMPSKITVGNINVIRDFIHVRDAVRAYESVARRGKRGEVYNVGSGMGISLKKILEELRKRSRVPFNIVVDPSRYRKDDFPKIVADASKLKQLGWKPKESIWHGLDELLSEWRNRV